MNLNQMLVAVKRTYDNTKPMAEIKDCLPGTLVVKASDANLQCGGFVRKTLDAGRLVMVVVPPFNDKDGAVTIGVKTLGNEDYCLIRLSNIKHA